MHNAPIIDRLVFLNVSYDETMKYLIEFGNRLDRARSQGCDETVEDLAEAFFYTKTAILLSEEENLFVLS